MNSQEFNSSLPVYDAIPESWEEARQYLVEQLKKISNVVNQREIGYFLDIELVSGKNFLPPIGLSGTSQQYRTIFRKVVIIGPIVAGVQSVPHGITFDVNFTLISLWVSATNSTTFNAITMSDPNNVTMDATNINITSPGAFDRVYAVVEYTLEV